MTNHYTLEIVIAHIGDRRRVDHRKLIGNTIIAVETNVKHDFVIHAQYSNKK